VIEYICVRRTACSDFPPEDKAKIAAFCRAIRELATEYFDYEIVTDFFPRPEPQEEVNPCR
jgi:hypothetical protein